MKAILEIQNVDQCFRSGFWLKPTQVLHGVSLQVPERSLFGFLGENGAGKTTLIHLITGLQKPTRGQVLVAGKKASSIKARQKIGYLPERPYFHEHLTGEGLLLYLGTLSGMGRRKILSRMDTVFSAVGLKDAKNLMLRNYSKGMLQRIGIAQALIHDPEFLVLDEPMSGLDPIGRKEMRELMVQLTAEGRTVFFSSHVISDVEAICDQVAVIRKGRLVGCGPIGEFLFKGIIRAEVAFSGISKEKIQSFEKLESIRFMPQEGIRAVVTSQDQANELVKKILDQGGKLLWVTPLRPSLEDIFLSDEKIGSR